MTPMLPVCGPQPKGHNGNLSPRHTALHPLSQATTLRTPTLKVLVLVAPKGEQQNKVHTCISKLRDAGKARIETKVDG